LHDALPIFAAAGSGEHTVSIAIAVAVLGDLAAGGHKGHLRAEVAVAGATGVGLARPDADHPLLVAGELAGGVLVLVAGGDREDGALGDGAVDGGLHRGARRTVTSQREVEHVSRTG